MIFKFAFVEKQDLTGSRVSSSEIIIFSIEIVRLIFLGIGWDVLFVFLNVLSIFLFGDGNVDEVLSVVKLDDVDESTGLFFVVSSEVILLLPFVILVILVFLGKGIDYRIQLGHLILELYLGLLS